MFNQSQTAFMKLHGVTEASIRDGTADVLHRLEIANRAADVDPVVAPVVATPLSAGQLAYLGNRKPEDLKDEIDIQNFKSLQSKAEAEPEAKTPVLDSPTDWRVAKLDHGRMWKELAPTDRLAVVDALNRIQKYGVANSREIDRLQAESWLLRA